MDKGILRLIDANFNRCKEGLRVVEDIFRFVTPEERLRTHTRQLRHDLDRIARENLIREGILSRDSAQDPGKPLDALESDRKGIQDILYANLQRAKESLRVLEETFKLTCPEQVKNIKQFRYDLYTLEKDILSQWPSLSDS
ncbi:MAG: thiamine-phosphate pyrophosphorylase [Candidatus Omnitrophica bacterium]|nr:thiamine-phosphate pyrophosphorylase [Candidatus Omnitrophota bacterium]